MPYRKGDWKQYLISWMILLLYAIPFLLLGYAAYKYYLWSTYNPRAPLPVGR